MGIDLALRQTGVVILSERGANVYNETLNYPLTRKKGEPPISDAEKIERLINLTNDIIRLTKMYKVQFVAIEGYAHDKRFQAHQIGEIAGNVKVQLWLAKKIVPEIVPPSTGRKHFFGYGKPSKEEIYEIIAERIGLTVEDGHQADAYVVARYAWDRIAHRERKWGNG